MSGCMSRRYVTIRKKNKTDSPSEGLIRPWNDYEGINGEATEGTIRFWTRSRTAKKTGSLVNRKSIMASRYLGYL